jgi:hypothetical protein
MSVNRQRLHKRTIELEGYLRDDGFWEIEAELGDIKGYDTVLMNRGLVPAGTKFHHMKIIMVVNDEFEIIDVKAHMYATPFTDCPEAEISYENLKGLKIQSGWINQVRERIERSSGCTHLNELLPAMATAAIQTREGYRMKLEKERHGKVLDRPQQHNTCRGYRDDALIHKQ